MHCLGPSTSLQRSFMVRYCRCPFLREYRYYASDNGYSVPLNRYKVQGKLNRQTSRWEYVGSDDFVPGSREACVFSHLRNKSVELFLEEVEISVIQLRTEVEESVVLQKVRREGNGGRLQARLERCIIRTLSDCVQYHSIVGANPISIPPS